MYKNLNNRNKNPNRPLLDSSIYMPFLNLNLRKPCTCHIFKHIIQRDFLLQNRNMHILYILHYVILIQLSIAQVLFKVVIFMLKTNTLITKCKTERLDTLHVPNVCMTSIAFS